MKKRIIKTGTSLGTIFSKQEREIYNIEVGDIIDMGEIIVIKNKKRRKKK